MKKILLWIITTLMCVFLISVYSLAGCAPAVDEPVVDEPVVDEPVVDEPVVDEPVVDEPLTFANISVSLGDEWLGYSMDAFQLAADKKGVEVHVYDSEWDAERHLHNMEDAIMRGADHLAVCIFTPEEAQTFIDMANEAGIPVSFENSLLDPADLTGDFVFNSSFNYYDPGYAAMKYISENWPNAKVFHLRGLPGMGIIEDYQRGVDDAVEEFGNIEIVANRDTSWSTESSMDATRDFIGAAIDFDTMFIHSDEMASGAVTALVDAGMLEDVKIIVSNGGPTGVAMLEAGEIDAAVSIPVSLQALLLFKAMWLYHQGIEPPEQVMVPPLEVVDMNNIEDLIPWEVTEERWDYFMDLIGGLDEW